MRCFSGKCLRALALILIVGLCPGIGISQGLLDAGFGGASDESAAFLVAGGRHVVTVAVAGRNLGAARLVGAGVEPRGKMVDPVSRVVVFEMPSTMSGAFRIAGRTPAGGLLKTPDGKISGRIKARVEQVAGKFLPFTLIQLRYDGAPPKPGTPLLDAAGAVAAIAHEASGGNHGGYALPVEVMHRALEAARLGKGAQRAWLGLTLKPGQGVPQVTGTVAGSPANQAGVIVGDVLTEVGGLKVADYGDAVNAFFLLRPGKSTSVKLKRGGLEQVLQLVPTVAKQ